MAAIRWGIIGCGDVTEVKSGPGFQKAVGSELVAVMRRDAGKAADYARRHAVGRWYTDADQLIADKDVDAVYVATPPGTHEFYAMKVLAARKPCYVEKPMARNTAEARRMVEGFKAAGVPLFVAYYRRALPRFLKVKEILNSGVLGRLEMMPYQYRDSQMLHRLDPVPWRLQAEHAGAGIFLDLGSHAIDLMDFFVGIDGSTGLAANISKIYPLEDYVSLTLVTPRGGAGMSWGFCHEENVDEYEFTGDKATMTFPCFANKPIRLRHADGREEFIDIPHPQHVQQPLIQTIVDELLGIGKCPSSGESALRTQAAMDAALEKYYGGREDGFWKRPWPGAGVTH